MVLMFSLGGGRRLLLDSVLELGIYLVIFTKNGGAAGIWRWTFQVFQEALRTMMPEKEQGNWELGYN